MNSDSPQLDFVAVLFRLLRMGALHDVNNVAAQTAIGRAVDTFEKLTRGEQEFYTFMLAGETPYVNGEPLKASRQIYENARTLGAILSAIGFNELLVRRGVTAGELTELAVKANQVESSEKTFNIGNSIRLRAVDPSIILGLAEDRRDVAEQVHDTYATAVVLSGRFQEGIQEDQLALSRHIKRISQHIVSLSDRAIEYYLAIALSPATPLVSRQLVHAAFAAVLVTRTITRDQHAMMRACYACMVGEIGHPRVAGVYGVDNAFGTDLRPQLNTTMKERAPASAAVMLMQMGYASGPALRRVVTGWETEWLMYSAELGWPYEGKMAARPEAIIAAICRKFVAARHDNDVPDQVFAKLAENSKSPVEIAAIKLLCAALGYYPRGAAVSLRGGAQGFVLNTYDFLELSNPNVIALVGENGPYKAPMTLTPGKDSPVIERVLHEPSAQLLEARAKWRTGSAPDPLAVLAASTTPDPHEDFGTLEIKIPPELQARFDEQ